MDAKSTLNQLAEEGEARGKEKTDARIAYEAMGPRLLLRFAEATMTPTDRIAATALRIQDQIAKVLEDGKDTVGIPPRLAAIIAREQAGEAVDVGDLIEAGIETVLEGPKGYRSPLPPAVNNAKETLTRMLAGKKVRLTDPRSLQAFFNDLKASLYGGKKEALKRAYGKDYVDPDTTPVTKETIKANFADEQFRQKTEALLIRVATNIHQGQISGSDARALLGFFENEHTKDLNNRRRWVILINLASLIQGIMISYVLGNPILKSLTKNHDHSHFKEMIFPTIIIIFMSISVYYIGSIAKGKLYEKFQEQAEALYIPHEFDDLIVYLKEAVNLLEAIEQKKASVANYAKEEETLVLIFRKMEEIKRRQTSKNRIATEEDDAKVGTQISTSSSATTTAATETKNNTDVEVEAETEVEEEGQAEKEAHAENTGAASKKKQRNSE